MTEVLLLLQRAWLSAVLFGVPFAATGGGSACDYDRPTAAASGFESAVADLRSKFPDVEIQRDDDPCLQARNTARAIGRTLGRNRHLESLSAYQAVTVARGEGYFSIEVFEMSDRTAINAFDAALTAYPSRKLKVEANTVYEHFVVGENLVLLVSSAANRRSNEPLMQAVRAAFERSARAGP